MTAREIIESVGATYMGEMIYFRKIQGKIVNCALLTFESPDMPGVTMHMWEGSVISKESIRNHIAWKRKEFGK